MLTDLLALVRAETEVKAGFRPLARESAVRAARAAEDRFIAARLDAWARFLDTKPVRKAG